MIDILCGFQVTSVQHQANFPVDTNPNTAVVRACKQADVTTVVLDVDAEFYKNKSMIWKHVFFRGGRYEDLHL